MTCSLHMQTWKDCAECVPVPPLDDSGLTIGCSVPDCGGAAAHGGHCFAHQPSIGDRPACRDTGCRVPLTARGHCIYGHSQRAKDRTSPAADNHRQGWQCPRCHTVHAPFVRSCECRP